MHSLTQACCEGVSRSPEGLKGTTAKWEGIDTYTTAPSGETKAAVIVVYDIFGFAPANPKFVVDHLAHKGFHAVMLDVYEGDAYPESKMNLVMAGDPDFKNWAAAKFSPDAFGKVIGTISRYVDHLHSSGFTKVGCIGFCYGGSVSAIAAATGKIHAAVSLHGGSHTVEQLEEAKCPVLYLVAKGDQAFPKVGEVAAYLKEHPNKGGLKEFEGVTHGWAVRGNYSDETIRKKADDAISDTAAFLKEHLVNH